MGILVAEENGADDPNCTLRDRAGLRTVTALPTPREIEEAEKVSSRFVEKKWEFKERAAVFSQPLNQCVKRLGQGEDS